VTLNNFPVFKEGRGQPVPCRRGKRALLARCGPVLRDKAAAVINWQCVTGREVGPAGAQYVDLPWRSRDTY
jgi:hypothetical protein